MKNFINYYYGLDIYDIYFNNGKYFFYHDKNSYMLKVCENNAILNCYQELETEIIKYSYFFKIVKNINNNYVTLIDNKPYVLLKLSNINNDKISVFDIKNDYYINININTKISTLNHFPWISLWENKIDYFEEWFYNKQSSHKKLMSLFNYFIGISENALLYFKETERIEKKEESDQLVVSHSRMTVNYELYDYYDPTNIIIDHSSRDISEYIKSLFINRIWDIDYISEYLEKNYFSRYGLRMIYSRIMFPSFFFDYIENMIINNMDIDLLYLESRLYEFQKFIKEISIFFKDKYNIPVISWILKET